MDGINHNKQTELHRRKGNRMSRKGLGLALGKRISESKGKQSSRQKKVHITVDGEHSDVSMLLLSTGCLDVRV